MFEKVKFTLINMLYKVKFENQRFFVKIKLQKIIKKLKNIANIIIVYIDFLVTYCFSIFPIDEHCIVLESEGDYTDNIRVFYEYLLKNKYNEKYKIVWIVHNPSKYKFEKNVKFVSRFGIGIHIKADYYSAICKYFIFSHPYWLKKWRKDQCVINTSHSVAQLKAGPYRPNKGLFNFVLCCSEYCAEVKKNNWVITDKQILFLGMPRIDLLFEKNEFVKERIKNYHGETIILSMETFKQSKTWDDSNYVDTYAINVVHTVGDMIILNEFLYKHNCILIVKIHHLQDLSFLSGRNFDNIIYLKDSDLFEMDVQVNQLLTCADVLLTDYSSVFYEYLLLDRPIGFLIGDMNEYTRGFIMDNPFEEMPGEKIRTLENLQQFIVEVINGKDDYINERKEIKEKVFMYPDNRNCERLLKWIESR